jgi:hypothetical protein
MSAPEAFIPLNGSAGNSAPVGGTAVVKGGRRHKLKLVTRKQARTILKKMGRKMRGGEEKDIVAAASGSDVTGAVTTDAVSGGRRRRGTKKTHRAGKRRSLFAKMMKY